jgi:hypothetical protein
MMKACLIICIAIAFALSTTSPSHGQKKAVPQQKAYVSVDLFEDCEHGIVEYVAGLRLVDSSLKLQTDELLAISKRFAYLTDHVTPAPGSLPVMDNPRRAPDEETEIRGLLASFETKKKEYHLSEVAISEKYLSPIFDKIKTAAASFARENGYSDIIFVSSTDPAKEKLVPDVTKAFISYYNESTLINKNLDIVN